MSKPGLNFSKDFHSDCGVCRFWKGGDTSTAAVDFSRLRTGECRRYAPSPVRDVLNEESPPWARWCVTLATDVCGEFAAEVEP